MAVRFAQPYRFTEQQRDRMAKAGILPRGGTQLIEGVPYQAGSPVRFSSNDYFRLGEIGVLDANERVELIDGEIIQRSPEGNRHLAASPGSCACFSGVCQGRAYFLMARSSFRTSTGRCRT